MLSTDRYLFIVRIDFEQRCDVLIDFNIHLFIDSMEYIHDRIFNASKNPWFSHITHKDESKYDDTMNLQLRITGCYTMDWGTRGSIPITIRGFNY